MKMPWSSAPENPGTVRILLEENLRIAYDPVLDEALPSDLDALLARLAEQDSTR